MKTRPLERFRLKRAIKDEAQGGQEPEHQTPPAPSLRVVENRPKQPEKIADFPAAIRQLEDRVIVVNEQFEPQKPAMLGFPEQDAIYGPGAPVGAAAGELEHMRRTWNELVADAQNAPKKTPEGTEILKVNEEWEKAQAGEAAFFAERQTGNGAREHELQQQGSDVEFNSVQARKFKLEQILERVEEAKKRAEYRESQEGKE